MSSAAETDHPAWYRAATLHERITTPPPGAGPLASSAPELACKRLRRWRQLTPFQDGSLFAERLSTAGMAEKDFLELLGEPDVALRDRLSVTPPWLSILDQAFRDHPSPLGLVCHPPGERVLPTEENVDYLQLAAPLLHRARKNLQQKIHSLARRGGDLPFDPETTEGLFTGDLPQQMRWTLGRTVALELYIAGLEGKLSGETSEERYRSFFKRLSDSAELRRLYLTYPVLARLLTVRLENWCAASCELLERLMKDWPKLRAVFSPGRDPGRLVELRSGLGDRHQGGRAVCSLRFASGLQLIYKPQPMAVAVHFQELLHWLNERGFSPALRTLEILDRGAYGWVEFVDAGPCRSSGEVCRFYQRQGSLLALLHALGGGDVHSENVIAQGAHPVLIDFETVIQPHWLSGSGTGQLVEFTKKMLERTVMRVGLLPVPRESDDLDRSGLGSAEGQRADCPHLAGSGTDNLRFERRSFAIEKGSHRPTLGGEAAKATDYSEEISEGFSRTYRFLLEHRADLLATAGPLRRFAADQVRIVVRPTRVYGALLQESYHPYLLGDALDRHRHFDHLWLDAVTLPRLKQLIPLENEALEAGDVPYFSTVLDRRDLLAGARQKLRGFLPSSGWQQLEGRFRALSENDLQRQLALISNALVADQCNTGAPPLRPAGYQAGEPGRGAGGRGVVGRGAVGRRLLAAAVRIGDRLETLAHRARLASGEELATWIQPSVTVAGKCVLVPMTAELYGGLPGVVLFLAHLGEMSGEERYTALARSAMATLDLQLAEDGHGLETVGAFLGWGGWLYTLTRLSVLWQEPELLARALAMLKGLPELIEDDPHHDVISGVAGLIPALLCLHRNAGAPAGRRSSSSRALKLAVLCGQRLLATARPQEVGVGWPSRRNGRALGGFSHGVAGIAWALFELAAAVGESSGERFADLALSAVLYERTLFDPAAGSWRDLRSAHLAHPGPGSGGLTPRATWCNGAPGIGLGRLGMLRHTGDVELRAEADVAVRTMMQAPLGISHSLCHGDLGNLELLLQAREVLGAAALDRDIEHRSLLILEDIEQHGWIDGTTSGMEAPGLMSGLAGIGYGLLRLAESERVPAVLLLADGPHV